MSEDQDRQKESEEILRRVEREHIGLFDSSLSRAADYLRAKDAPPDDRIEAWGRRIARLLSLIALLAITLWVLADYLADK
ncbi:hypothetical protein [Methylovirgula sp. 4M-Z18]|uniref:hypothetical protein n=1 Tax=Methylovirgula sp. 4M-Z18 TaxID=2293567 RepID=UPI000E2FB635|nr:hypothetical protein [Methylovirgula sp. 4M-Z18]RFB75579.1 hypothetical protein DYH55_22210 [Methylovirgula sp. 4M-Z18]